MGKRENFTAGRVASFKCQLGKQQSIYWDGKAPGLGLRVTAAGTKSFIFETSLHGKTLRLTIGDARTWSIGKAQSEAASLKTLTDKGIDPRQQKAEQKARAEAVLKEAERRKLTVAEAWYAYIEARREKWSARHLADHQNLAHPGGDPVKGRNRLSEAGALAPIMRFKLAEIDSDRVREWLEDETARRPTQAALAYRLLRAFLNWCSSKSAYKGIAGDDACHASIARDTLPKRIAKTDCLQRGQLLAWFSAVHAVNNPVIAAYLQVLLLIGSRREELAALQWGDVDFRWKKITIHDKVEGERAIPLTPYVAALLKSLPRRNRWVFSSPTSASGRLREPSIQHRAACAMAGIEELTLHGLRRSFATLAEWVECPVGVVAQIMGHKPSATAEKHYKIRPLDLLRMWHTKIEAWMLEQAGIEFAQAQPTLMVVK